MHKSDKLFSSSSDSRDKRLCLPHCSSNIWVAAFKFLPLLEASLCSNSSRKNIVSHISGSTKMSQGLKQAVRVLTWQCKSGNWVCMHHGEICCQNNRSHGALSGWSENYFATCLVSLLASEVFYRMKPIFHKTKGQNIKTNCYVAQSLSLPSTNPMQSKGQILSLPKSIQILPCTVAALCSSCLTELS